MMQSESNDHRPAVPVDSSDGLVSETVARFWPEECRQFAAALQAARQGQSVAAVLIGEPGRGKTWLLSALMRDLRASGDAGLHLNLDRYFTPEAFAARAASRFLRLNEGLLDRELPEVADPVARLHAVLGAADETVAENGRAVVLGLSGLEASLDAPPDLRLFDTVAELTETARDQWRHTFVVIELRPRHIRPELELLSRSGLVYFPINEPSEEVVEQVLAECAAGLIPFAPSVVPMASARARGNLHRLLAAMRSISSRGEAAQISEVGPVEWEALAGKGISSDIEDLARSARGELLAAIADWPSGGYIPLDEIAWRLSVEGVVTDPDEFSDMIASLAHTGAVLGLRPIGDPPHLRFEWSELRTAMTRAALDRASEKEVSRRRALQASIVVAKQSAEAGDVAEAIRRLHEVVAETSDATLHVFRIQSATIASEIWQGVHDAPPVDRAPAAELLVEAAGSGACPVIVSGLTWPEIELQGAAATCLVGIGEDAVAEIARLVGSRDQGVRLRAVDVLARIPCDGSLFAVLPLLEDSDTGLQLAALDALARLNDQRAGDSIAALVSSRDPQIREASIRCIGALEYAPALPAVSEALGDESDRVRSAAAGALATIGDETAVPLLIDHLREGRPESRRAAAKALAIFGEPAREALLLGLESSDAAERASSARGFLFFPADQAVPAVLDCLRDRDGVVVEAAGECLVQFGGDAVEPVASLLADRADNVREAAVHTLARIGEPAVPSLQDHLEDRATWVRAAAVAALGEMCHAPSVPSLARAAGDAETEVRLAVVDALTSIGTEEALHPVVEAMSDPSTQVANAATVAVGRFGELAIGPLLGHLTDASGSAVEVVTQTLADLGEVATARVCDVLGEYDTGRQSAALEALRRIHDPQCLTAVAACLKDDALVSQASDLLLSFGATAMSPVMALLAGEDAVERQAAADVAVRAGDVAVAPTIEVLRSDAAHARVCAAQVLGRLGSTDAVQRLTETLNDVEPGVRVACSTALGRIGDVRAVDQLVLCTRDLSAEVVTAAAQALAGFREAAIAALLGSYQAHEDQDLSALAAVLREMGAGCIGLVPAFLGSERPQLRAGAINVLRELDMDAQIPQIVALLSDGEQTVAQAARAAIVSFGRASVESLVSALVEGDEILRAEALSVAVEIGQAALPGVLDLLGAESPDVRSIGVAAAAEFGEAAVAPVTAVLGTGEQPYTRCTAAECLARIASPAALEGLSGGLSDAVPAVRMTVVQGLAHISHDSSITPLIEAMVDEHAGVSQLAREAMQAYGERAVQPLIDRLNAPALDIRAAAANVLAEMGDVCVAPLVALLADADLESQAEAIGVLQRLAAHDAVAATIDLLTAPAPVNGAARRFVIALPQLCLPKLMECLGADDDGLRGASQELCVELGPLSVDPLVGVLASDDPVAQIGAIDALVRIGDPEAILPLIAAARDAGVAVRVRALRVLGGFGDTRAVPVLCETLTDEDETVRRTAAASLISFGVTALSALIRRSRLHEVAVSDHLVQALEAMGEPALEGLAELVYAHDGTVRAGAVNCLTALREQTVTDQLPALMSDSDPYVHEAALGVVAAFKSEALPHAVTALSQGDEVQAGLAKRALLVIGEPAVEPVVELMLDREHPDRQRAIEMLGSLGNPSALPSLIEVMAESEEQVAAAAQDVVVGFGALAVGPLLDEMESPEPAMRRAVAGALARLDELVRPAMLDIVEQGEPARQAIVIGILSEMRATEAAEPVSSLIGGDPVVAEPARAFLLEFEDAALPLLRARLGADSADLRAAAADLLVEIGLGALPFVSDAVLQDSTVARVEATRILQCPGRVGLCAGEAWRDRGRTPVHSGRRRGSPDSRHRGARPVRAARG